MDSHDMVTLTLTGFNLTHAERDRVQKEAQETITSLPPEDRADIQVEYCDGMLIDRPRVSLDTTDVGRLQYAIAKILEPLLVRLTAEAWLENRTLRLTLICELEREKRA